MAGRGRSGNVRTVGYMSPDGVMHMFENSKGDSKGYIESIGKMVVSTHKACWDKAWTRLAEGTWEEIDDYLFSDVKSEWEKVH